MGSHSFLQGIFLSKGSNPGLLHCREILYHLSTRVLPSLSCLFEIFYYILGFHGGSGVKNLPAMQETGVKSLGQEDPLEKLQPTLVFLPGESYGQKSLVGYSPWHHKRWT